MFFINFGKFEVQDCTSSICDKINDHFEKKLNENIQMINVLCKFFPET